MSDYSAVLPCGDRRLAPFELFLGDRLKIRLGGNVNMKKILLLGMALGALIVPAAAADLAPYYKAAPPAPIFSWTGCYIGGDVGGAWSSQDVSNSSPASTDQGGVTGTINANGVIGGAYGGCNFQWTNAWVVGIEGDWSGANLNGTAVGPNLLANGTPVGSGGLAWTSNLDSVATIRGRLGYIWAPNILLYATGGGAWGRTSYTSVDAFSGGCPNCGTTAFSNTASGWVVGAGVDWAPWSNNWIVRVEYLHYDLEGATSTSFFSGGGVAANPTWNNMTIDSVRAGLSYKFW
jgi:outer membrane immunogenic protein